MIKFCLVVNTYYIIEVSYFIGVIPNQIPLVMDLVQYLDGLTI